MDPNEMKARKKASVNRTGNPGSGNRYAFMNQNQGMDQGKFDCSRLDPVTVLNAVSAVTERGDMISFTLTTDGGALCISVVCNGTRNKVYAPSVNQAHDVLEALAV